MAGGEATYDKITEKVSKQFKKFIWRNYQKSRILKLRNVFNSFTYSFIKCILDTHCVQDTLWEAKTANVVRWQRKLSLAKGYTKRLKRLLTKRSDLYLSYQKPREKLCFNL